MCPKFLKNTFFAVPYSLQRIRSGRASWSNLSFTVHLRCLERRWLQDRRFWDHMTRNGQYFWTTLDDQVLHKSRQKWSSVYERKSRYPFAALWQCSQPHVSACSWVPDETQGGNAASVSLQPWQRFVSRIKTLLKGCRLTAVTKRS